jgi:hypothetical protein
VDPSTSWDVYPDDPAPDVYVILNCGSSSATSTVINDSYDAVWSNGYYMFIETAQNLMQQIQFQIYDKDIWFNDLICDATDKFYSFELTSGTSTIPYPCSDVTSIKFKLY